MLVNRSYFEEIKGKLDLVIEADLKEPKDSDATKNIKEEVKKEKNKISELLLKEEKVENGYLVNTIETLLSNLKTIKNKNKDKTWLGFGTPVAPLIAGNHLPTAIKAIEKIQEKIENAQSNLPNKYIEERLRKLEQGQEKLKQNNIELSKKNEVLENQLKQIQVAQQGIENHIVNVYLGEITPQQLKDYETSFNTRLDPKNYKLIEAPIGQKVAPAVSNNNRFHSTLKIEDLPKHYTIAFQEIPSDNKQRSEWGKANTIGYTQWKIHQCVSPKVYAMIFELQKLYAENNNGLKDTLSEMIYWWLDVSLLEKNDYADIAWTDKFSAFKKAFALDTHSNNYKEILAIDEKSYSDNLPNNELKMRFQTLQKPALEGNFLPKNADAQERYKTEQVKYRVELRSNVPSNAPIMEEID